MHEKFTPVKLYLFGAPSDQNEEENKKALKELTGLEESPAPYFLIVDDQGRVRHRFGYNIGYNFNPDTLIAELEKGLKNR